MLDMMVVIREHENSASKMIPPSCSGVVIASHTGTVVALSGRGESGSQAQFLFQCFRKLVHTQGGEAVDSGAGEETVGFTASLPIPSRCHARNHDLYVRPLDLAQLAKRLIFGVKSGMRNGLDIESSWKRGQYPLV